MPRKKSLNKRISQEFSRRVTSESTSKWSQFKSNIRMRIETLVPMEVRWMLPFLEEELKQVTKEEEEEGTTGATTATGIAPPGKILPIFAPVYQKYPCTDGDHLGCKRLQGIEQKESDSKSCLECGFPAILWEKDLIQGSRGRYKIEGFLQRRGIGRLYQASQVADNQPVVIKEYLLPDLYFNKKEAEARKKDFELNAGVNLADGREQDFRLCHPTEAIADLNKERCYLVSRGNHELHPTLNEYLANNGPMDAIAVRQLLYQVLQTLEFLHRQKYRLPSGQVRTGLAHGNINLNSLLIAKNYEKSLYSQNGLKDTEFYANSWHNADFFIYVCDLALWENLFNPPTTLPSNSSPLQDLKDLGYVAFHLLAGNPVNPRTGQPLNPKDEQQWPSVDFALKGFIFRLMGLGVSFESAEEARKALLKLPFEKQNNQSKTLPLTTDEEKPKRFRLLYLLLALLALLLLAAFIWWLIPKPQANENFGNLTLTRSISEVTSVPGGNFTYTADREGTSYYILNQKNLVEKDQELEQKLREIQPKLDLTYKQVTSGKEAIEKVRSGEVDFAIVSLYNQLPPDLDYEEIAYDGILVFVNFSYAQRENSLPSALNGQISFDNLRKIYTGKITNWRELGGPNLPIKLYIPNESEALEIFEQRVLKTNQDIELFRNLAIQQKTEQSGEFINPPRPEITKLPFFPMLRSVIRGFENERVGAIAFGTLSKVFQQCSVYPLALKVGENPPVQPLIQDNGQPVAPTTDLCNDKGRYQPSFDLFKNEKYPLAYPLVVVYPRDNSRPPVGAKFAEILRTKEGQKLLVKTGLVPYDQVIDNAKNEA